MSSFHEDDPLGKSYDSQLLRRLLTYLRPYKAAVGVSFLLIVLMAGLDLVGPYLTKVAIDRYMTKGDAHGVTRVAALYLATLMAAFAVRFGQVYILQLTGQRIVLDMRRQVFGQLQRLEVAFFDRNPVGRLITRVTTDVDAVNELFTSGVVTVFGDLFTLLGIMGVMLAMNWKLALVTFSVLPLFFLVTNWFRRGARESFRDVRKWVARINAFMQENLTGMAVVQLFRREERNAASFARINRSHADANLRSIFFYAIFYPAIDILAAVAVALILLYGGGRVLAGSLTLGALVAFVQYSERFWRPISDLSDKFNILQAAMASSERIFVLLDTEPRVVPPARPVAITGTGHVAFEHVWFTYQTATSAQPQLQLQPSPELAPIPVDGTGVEGAAQPGPQVQAAREAGFTPAKRAGVQGGAAQPPIAQNDAGFTPAEPAAEFTSAERAVIQGAASDGSQQPAASGAGFIPAEGAGVQGGPAQAPLAQYNAAWVLRDIDFVVEPGRSVALVGATGAGKTSIISLLTRFYDVQSGSVKLDGVDVRDMDPGRLRSSLALVLQDVHLFSGTIASNIRLGSPISDERVREAARAVHAHRFIEALPQGYDTEVKERGATLSLGQKQLLSFARALAHDPRVLVLDEATSSIDTETEALIQDALRVLLRRRTAIIIAHRLSTIQNVDEILVLHKGRIRERGRHQELLARRGIYWRLYQLQYKDQEVRVHGTSGAPATA